MYMYNVGRILSQIMLIKVFATVLCLRSDFLIPARLLTYLYACKKEAYILVARVSLILPPPGGKMRDPGNEVGKRIET